MRRNTSRFHRLPFVNLHPLGSSGPSSQAENRSSQPSSRAREAPAWAIQPYTPLSAELITEVQVWRAATHVDPSDLRPTGPPQLSHATPAWQPQFDKRLA